MEFTCTRCTSEIKIIGPYTPKLARTTRLITSHDGLNKMAVTNDVVHCSNCGAISHVLTSANWLDLLLADLNEGCLLVIKSLTDVYLIYHTEYDVSKPLYKLDQVEIDQFVSLCGITFKQLGTSNGSTVIANLTVNGNVNANIVIGNDNQSKTTIKAKGIDINVIMLGDGLIFTNRK